MIVRDHMQQYIDAACSSAETNVLWAFLQVAGPVLDREATERDAAAAADLTGLWSARAPPPRMSPRASPPSTRSSPARKARFES
ncbi:hypothetical protein OV079_37140 [Nannocystis pusilla]|uniref:Uncharacterized protein n=1 Tax=Nannocystis pusilla TaxID=889268 RepID=A0A9X3J1G3_9BACT|nr:hypothetical protein [Nannocystis pusilla]MCY1011095.1 hypothetical protein [Nannocystis pusilla]